MARRKDLGTDRILSDALDGEFDQLKKIAKAHAMHDSGRDAKPARGSRTAKSSSEAASPNANRPQKRGWRR
ncbi:MULTISPECIES: hypothetical protein [Streptomyces]|uniref:hypothetical protein n=1 Tax=Streptomyces nigra TaxID=1827580 RepID=UPI0036A90B15